MAGPRFSIAWRIILGTVFLILLLLAGFGFLSTKRLEKVYAETSDEQQAQFIKNMKFAGKAQLFSLSKLASKFIKSSEFNELADAIPPIGREDSKVDSIIVFDERGNLLAYYDARYPNAKIKKEDKVYLVGDRALSGKKEVTFSGFPWDMILVKSGSPFAKPGNASKPPVTGLPKGKDTISKMTVGKRKMGVDGKEHMIFVRPIIEENTYLGTVIMIYNLYSLKQYEKKLAASLKSAKKESINRILLFGAILLFFGAFLAVFQGLSITRPIKSLVKSVATFANGDLLHRVKIKTNDEIQVLGEGFNFMAENLVILLQETEKKAVMAKELEVAQTIQSTLVPPEGIHEFEGFEIAGHFQPASETGGDWWYFYQLDDGRLLVIIGDVTGHGVPAAMITASAKSSCDTLLAVEHRIPDLNQFMKVLNVAIEASGKGKFFMTCFASIIDIKNRKMTYVNAGHNFPYLYRASDDKFYQMMARGNRLGETVNTDFEIKEQELKTDDLLIWFTDGIIEDVNPEDMEYGEKRFRRSIRSVASEPLDKVIEKVVGDAETYYEGIAHQDDHTLIFGKIKNS